MRTYRWLVSKPYGGWLVVAVLALLAAFLLCPNLHAATIACVTTPGTYNINSGASWVGGVVPAPGVDRITCGTNGVNIIANVNYTIGDSPAAGTNVITFTNGAVLGIAQNITLTAQGGVSVAGSIQFAAGSVLQFESSGAASPTATPYTLTAVTATADATHPPTSASRFLVTADTISGTNFRMANSVAGSGTSGWINGEIQNCGDPAGAAPCFPYTPGGSHGTLSFGGVGTPFTFDHTCGVTWGTGYTSADSWDFQNVTFSNTYAACLYPWIGTTGFNQPSGTRLFDTVVFDLPPQIEAHGATLNHSIFLKGWFNPNAFTSGTPAFMLVENSLIVESWQNGTLIWSGNLGVVNPDIILTNDILLADPTTTFGPTPTAQTPTVTGTVTSATNGTTTSTFTDSTKSFTTNQFAPIATSGGAIFGVMITGGTGAGEMNPILSNTSTTVTVIENWLTRPDATSTYAIYKGPLNVHFTGGYKAPLNTIMPVYSGNIFTGATLFDNNGDGFHSMTSLTGATCNNWFGPWSSARAYLTFSSVSEAGILYRSTTSTTNNDPSTDGGAHWTVAASLDSLVSGCAVYEIDNNIVLPNIAHDNTSTLISPGQALWIIKHNSGFSGAQSVVQFNESSTPTVPNGVNFPHQFTMTSNLAYADSTRTYVLAGQGASTSVLGPWILTDITSGGGPSVSDVTDPCVFSGGASTCDYNGEYGQLSPGWCFNPAGDNQGGSPYVNVSCTVPQGTHDVAGNPGLLRSFPSAQGWLQSLGIDTGISDGIAIMPDVYSCLIKVNDASGFNPSCTVANLYNYLHSSVNFTNVAFHNAGADSLDMGAGQYQAPVVPNFSSTNTRWIGTTVIQ